LLGSCIEIPSKRPIVNAEFDEGFPEKENIIYEVDLEKAKVKPMIFIKSKGFFEKEYFFDAPALDVISLRIFYTAKIDRDYYVFSYLVEKNGVRNYLNLLAKVKDGILFIISPNGKDYGYSIDDEFIEAMKNKGIIFFEEEFKKNDGSKTKREYLRITNRMKILKIIKETIVDFGEKRMIVEKPTWYTEKAIRREFPDIVDLMQRDFEKSKNCFKKSLPLIKCLDKYFKS